MEELFPIHKGGLHLEHNPHHGVYGTIDEWLSGHHYYWVSDTQAVKAKMADTLWVLKWWPRTPVVSVTIAGADLEEVLAHARHVMETEYAPLV